MRMNVTNSAQQTCLSSDQTASSIWPFSAAHVARGLEESRAPLDSLSLSLLPLGTRLYAFVIPDVDALIDRIDTCGIEVYSWCMSRTNIDIDDHACAEVMRRYRFATKKEAVNFALKVLAAEPLNLEEAMTLRGSGWEGDLDELRSTRPG